MVTANLAPTLEDGEWVCFCGNKTKDSVVADNNSEPSLVSTLFLNKKLCPDCGQPMFFEPYLKGGPSRDTIFNKKLEA